eukprot:GILI01019176.1.p1 GENE.GILI01019176.1~~GILI01019176.1.p1  ORF type:complete len:151 (+),score=31.87 GILI01019176.1:89-541(+)
MPPIILEDDFKVEAIDPDNRVYVRVSRAVCATADKSLTVVTDFNLEEYPILAGDRLHIAVASSLNRSGAHEQPVYDHSIYHRDTLLNDYEYVMHGKIYECTAGNASAGAAAKVTVLISFGGLLTKIEGSPSSLKEMHLNSDVFLLIRKVK